MSRLKGLCTVNENVHTGTSSWNFRLSGAKEDSKASGGRKSCTNNEYKNNTRLFSSCYMPLM